MEKGYYIFCYGKIATAYKSQSTIKMEKGYYPNSTHKTQNKFFVAIHNKNGKGLLQFLIANFDLDVELSQSTIKMEKGYYGNF